MRWKGGEHCHFLLAFPFPLKKESVLTRRVVSLCVSIRDGREKEEAETAKKVDNYALPPPFSFGFSFSPWKKNTSTLSAHSPQAKPVWKYRRWKKRKNGEETAKRQISTPLRSHHPLVLLFPLQKKMCILIRTLKGVEDPEKAALSFGSSLFPEKRMCASLYTFYTRWNMCIHGDGKRDEKKWWKAVIFLLFFSFLCKKICASLYTSNMAEHMCRHGEWKGETEWAKRRVSTHFRSHHPLVLLFPLQ